MEAEKRGFSERPNRFPWPPVIYGIALLAGWPLGHFLPLPWFGGMAAELLFATGFLAIAAAIAGEVAAALILRKKKTTVLPHRRSDHLVTSGMFAISRNPIYLGNTVLVIGAGLISGIAWYIPLAFLAAWLTQKLAIEREEKHLEARFGKPYRDYKKRINRWI